MQPDTHFHRLYCCQISVTKLAKLIRSLMLVSIYAQLPSSPPQDINHRVVLLVIKQSKVTNYCTIYLFFLPRVRLVEKLRLVYADGASSRTFYISRKKNIFGWKDEKHHNQTKTLFFVIGKVSLKTKETSKRKCFVKLAINLAVV